MSTLTFGLRMTMLAAVLLPASCAVEPAPENGGEETSETEQASLVSGCGLFVGAPLSGAKELTASVECDHYVTAQVEVCMQQLVTGGWETIDWTCVTSPRGWSPSMAAWSKPLPYYTNNRYYRGWGWGYTNGVTVSHVSASCKGNGGAGCF